MKNISSIFKTGLLAVSLIVAPAAQAQVNGIAYADEATAMANSQPLRTAYQQINQTFASNFQQIQAKQQEVVNISKQLDTNGDNDVSDQELQAAQAANNPVLQQIATKRNEIAQLSQPVARAEIYVVEQIIRDFSNARQQVINDKKINIILSPESLVYAPNEANVTSAITEVINTRLTSPLSITPPTDWRPNQQIAQVHQRIQQILRIQAAIARQQQQQGQAPAQPQQQQPTGR